MSEYELLKRRVGQAAADRAVAFGWINGPQQEVDQQMTLPDISFAESKSDRPTTQKSRQSQLGQFLTSESVSAFMAEMFPEFPKNILLLDAGAGKGALTTAFVDRCKEHRNVENIVAHAYELDEIVLGELRHTAIKLRELHGIESEVFFCDFVEQATKMLRFGNGPRYTHAILNPPYRKIGTASHHRALLRSIGLETVNLYSGFVGLALSLMEAGGELVAIIPRSFCNGPYYQPFRRFLFARAAIQHIHLFDARNKAFKNDGVLQENIVVRLTRGVRQGPVTVSLSTDDKFSDYSEALHPFASIVHPDDAEQFIRIPTDDAVELLESPAFSHRLEDLGVSVSTGPVVDFRLKQYLRADPEPGTVPLLYPGHFKGDGLTWPKSGFRKANAIRHTSETSRWLFPTGFYAVVRRFSSKEERRRIVANVVEPSVLQTDHIGFENHLNILHNQKRPLSELMAHGISVYLNTTAVDQYFRRFNGHTQVNATDLRSMRYPSREALLALGAWVKENPRPTQEAINKRAADIA